jgi:hypothetical protein
MDIHIGVSKDRDTGQHQLYIDLPPEMDVTDQRAVCTWAVAELQAVLDSLQSQSDEVAELERWYGQASDLH